MNWVNLFDIEKLEKQLKELENETVQENFWSDSKNSNKILTKIKTIKNKTSEYRRLESEVINLQELAELAQLERDNEIADEILKNANKLEKDIEKFEINTFLSGTYDSNNAIVTIHPGARRNRITRLGRDVISYVYKVGK